MAGWRRFTAVEYGTPTALIEQIAGETEFSADEARTLLFQAADRIRQLLRLESRPLFVDGDQIRFRDVAGLIVLAPGLEIEVAPKFLGETEAWREDFFLLASLSHHGRLLDGLDVRASSRETSALTTLIGRSLVETYWRNHRRPLRSYMRHNVTTFSIDGEFEPEELMTPAEEGFRQEVTSFSRINPYNAVIRAAAERLASVMPDVETRVRLERVAQHLPRQPRPHRLAGRRLPSRSRRWQSLYDLSHDVLRGFGGAYDPEHVRGPGFVLRTWPAWEQLITSASKRAFGVRNVASQPSHRLGRRLSGGKSSDVYVYPDLVVSVGSAGRTRRVVVDAKYKARTGTKTRSISSADLYEALAFGQAADVAEIVLVFPGRVESGTSVVGSVGQAAEFSSVSVNGVRVRGVELGVCGISRRGGLQKFETALAATVRNGLRPDCEYNDDRSG